jgi:hypothetical protein
LPETARKGRTTTAAIIFFIGKYLSRRTEKRLSATL